jgi:hypothetical protein
MICFPHELSSGGVNLAIRELGFDGDRIDFVAYDVWTKGAAEDAHAMSCRLDGSDYGKPRPRWSYAVVEHPGGSAIVATHPAVGTRVLAESTSFFGAIAFRAAR